MVKQAGAPGCVSAGARLGACMGVCDAQIFQSQESNKAGNKMGANPGNRPPILGGCS